MDKVLVIEDDHLLRGFLTTEAHALFGDCQLRATDTLRAGLQSLESDDADLIVLDLGLPDSSGLDSIPRVREKSDKALLIVLTGSYVPQDVDLAFEKGADAYLPKNGLSPDELSAAIKKVKAGAAVDVQPRVIGEVDIAYSGLTKMEQKVLSLKLAGETNRMIGEALNIGIETVRTHLANIRRKLPDTI